MSGWWNGFLVVFLSCFLVVNTKLDLTSTLKLAHCRASCLFKIKMYNVTDSTCSATPACEKCWNTCKSLLKDMTNLHYCRKPSCFKNTFNNVLWDDTSTPDLQDNHLGKDVGCQEACRYFQLSPRPPIVLTHHEDTLTVTSGEVRWTPLKSETQSAVYVVLNQGEVLCQTLDFRVELPHGLLEEIRVLRVDWRGQTTVLGPKLESSLSRLRTVLRSLGLPQPPSTTLSKSLNVPLDWRLREESMTSTESLVMVRISWDASQLVGSAVAATQLTYLVTWEVDDGVLRGNLLTNSTKATLSLKPDTVYKIQVAVVSEYGGIQSEPLVLDTHKALTATGSPDTSRSTVEVSSTLSMAYNIVAVQTTTVDSVALGVAVITSVLMLLVLTTSWRYRHRMSLPHSQLVVEDQQSPSLYRVFSPAVRLIGDREYASPELYSSTDNLLKQ